MTDQEILKITSEPYFNELYEKHGIAYCLQKGFYFNSSTKVPDWEQHVKIPCTPINFIKEKLSQSKKPCVIISTGAHCPMHEGHIEMMRVAKQKLELEGWDVVGGYLSPGHNEYIKEKIGDQYMTIHDRLEYANNLIKDEHWLAIDPWEGVYTTGSVNFTSVVYRFQQYITYWAKQNIKVFYICGSDNERFQYVFRDTKIGVVIVTRPGYSDKIDISLKHKYSCYIAVNQNGLSSTEVRKTQQYLNYLSSKKLQKQLYLRMNWNFVEKCVLVELKHWFVSVFPQDVEYQKDQYLKNIAHLKTKVINLDSVIDQGIKLEISRMYDNYGQKFLTYTNRPGTNSIINQLAWIKHLHKFKECVLFDDDICGGSLMRYVESKLKDDDIEVIGKTSFISSNSEHTEILDAKDFILGYEDGGLVTQIGKRIARVPYIYPFVCPKSRASISDPLQFSINIWKINMDFYINKNDKISDCSDLKYFLKLGFNKYNTLYDISKYYYDFLNTFR